MAFQLIDAAGGIEQPAGDRITEADFRRIAHSIFTKVARSRPVGDGPLRYWTAFEVAPEHASTQTEWIAGPWLLTIGAITEPDGRVKAAGKTTLALGGGALSRRMPGLPVSRRPAVIDLRAAMTLGRSPTQADVSLHRGLLQAASASCTPVHRERHRHVLSGDLYRRPHAPVPPIESWRSSWPCSARGLRSRPSSA